MESEKHRTTKILTLQWHNIPTANTRWSTQTGGKCFVFTFDMFRQTINYYCGRRLQYVCNQMLNIKYSPYKMYFVASMVRGMTVDEALRQLKMCSKKGATFAHDAILEAQELAVQEHNVEYRSNLWVGEYKQSDWILFVLIEFVNLIIFIPILQLNRSRLKVWWLRVCDDMQRDEWVWWNTCIHIILYVWRRAHHPPITTEEIKRQRKCWTPGWTRKEIEKSSIHCKCSHIARLVVKIKYKIKTFLEYCIVILFAFISWL